MSRDSPPIKSSAAPLRVRPDPSLKLIRSGGGGRASDIAIRARVAGRV
jgi:hypothetical protein